MESKRTDRAIRDVIEHKIEECEACNGWQGTIAVTPSQLEEVRILLEQGDDFEVVCTPREEVVARAWLGVNSDSCPFQAEDFVPVAVQVGVDIKIMRKGH